MTLCMRSAIPVPEQVSLSWSDCSRRQALPTPTRQKVEVRQPSGLRRKTPSPIATASGPFCCHREIDPTPIIDSLNSTSWAILTTLTALHTQAAMSKASASSSPTEASNGYPWILEHILSYPGTYEIPLRTMYTLNSSPRAQPLPQQFSRPTSPSSGSPLHSPISSPTSAKFPTDQYDLYTQSTNDHFKTNLMAQLSHLPTQQASLPPSFITTFVRRCFAEDLVNVDFPHALTGLDYLRDLETRRKREIAAALGRLGVRKGDLSEANKSAHVAEWMKRISKHEEKCETLYTKCYIGLRRWTLINEMSLVPFNKPSCYAMLNTLYPPTSHPQTLTPQITPQILQSQRDGFWRYIQAVEKNGPDILKNLTEQGRRPDHGETTGWSSTREVIDAYLRLANAVIDECTSISGPEILSANGSAKLTMSSATNVEDRPETRGGRKVDSGISFSSDDRPSTSGESRATASTSGDSRATASTSASSVHPMTAPSSSAPSPSKPRLNTSKSLPASPTFGQSANTPTATFPPHLTPSAKPLSTLEKLVRRMRKKGDGEIFLSTDATAANANQPAGKKYPPSAFPGSSKSLRKQLSLDTNRLRTANASTISIEAGRAGFRSRAPSSGWER